MDVAATADKAMHKHQLAYGPCNRLGQHRYRDRQAVVDQCHVRRETYRWICTNAGIRHGYRNGAPQICEACLALAAAQDQRTTARMLEADRAIEAYIEGRSAHR
jgi:hypothetical protein